MNVAKFFGILVVVLLLSGALILFLAPYSHAAEQPKLKNFSSCDELKTYLEENKMDDYYGPYFLTDVVLEAAQPTGTAVKSDSRASDYSTTNIQVEGVDEADIVKSDGRYIYVVSGNLFYIVDAYPAENAKVISKIRTGMTSTELFVNEDKVVLFGYSKYGGTAVRIYDISNKTKPVLEKKFSMKGYYSDSRMIGDYVYMIVNKPVYRWYAQGEEIELPSISYDNETNESAGCGRVYYFDEPSDSYSFSTVLSIDLEDNNVTSKVFLTGSSENIFVSEDNIYVTHTTPRYYYGITEDVIKKTTGIPIRPDYSEKTIIHRLAIGNGSVEYKAKGEVPGRVLNQFSMDEYDGYFRIATTSGSVARFSGDATSKNNVYVLDEDLETVGKLEDLAPGETIYSARFMGKRAYLVTFRKVDPLFVIDLAEPKDPQVLGKLKIPGYSDYLHPYDENHLIGLGKEAIPADNGDFSWFQGVKLSLFDVTNVSKPKEIAKYEIGDRGTDSYALRDHKAFLFSKSKNLLVIPVLLAEIDESSYAGRSEQWQYGDYTFQGAYVFDVSKQNGFKLKGRVTHMDNQSELMKSGYYFYSDYSVKRSLYMDDVLYTISDELIKANSLKDLKEIKEVELS
jgi:uncharacterized secreted protein with C-terminal beta-propeller domain